MKKNISLTTAEKILNSAEKLFAECDYAEVSIRKITDDANVRLGLLHYHFGCKEDLYRSVIKRRIGKLSDERIKLLQHYQNISQNGILKFEHIVDAFITPYLYNTIFGEEGWKAYARIIAKLRCSGSATLSLSITDEQFDPCAELFIDEIRKSATSSTEEQVQWGFDFLVASMSSAFAEINRIKILSRGLCSVEQTQTTCQYLYNYIVGGLKTVLTSSPYYFADSFSIIDTFQEK